MKAELDVLCLPHYFFDFVESSQATGFPLHISDTRSLAIDLATLLHVTEVFEDFHSVE